MSSSSQHNSEFLLGLLLEENKHINPIDFIVDKQNKARNYCCVCVALGVCENADKIRSTFKSVDDFSAEYFNVYVSALDNYHSIVRNDLRQIFVDEAKVFYPQKFQTTTISSLVTNEANRANAMALLDSIKNKHSHMVIMRDEIAIVIIHYENDNYIVIDPHIECCGILSKTGVYRYVVYDSVWNFDVHLMVPEDTTENGPSASTEPQNVPSVSIEPQNVPSVVPENVPSVVPEPQNAFPEQNTVSTITNETTNNEILTQ
ncbi:putative ORFan [Tupanvirus deep ocean]|uniref:ORFan n=2 Tax=Tupanvirus TaxID=2094720 RepID=A0AC62AAG2_9VIRU|nr:putative ORFan [Tupanvirus deep ocean]QKU34633.1 putative ORFan [Tupanvirus deep ocean]